VTNEGGNPVEIHNPVTINCDRNITSASSGNISNDLRTATSILGDGGFLTSTVDTSSVAGTADAGHGHGHGHGHCRGKTIRLIIGCLR